MKFFNQFLVILENTINEKFVKIFKFEYYYKMILITFNSDI